MNEFEVTPLVCVGINKMRGFEDEGEGDTDVNDLTRAQIITRQLAIGTHRLFL